MRLTRLGLKPPLSMMNQKWCDQFRVNFGIEFLHTAVATLALARECSRRGTVEKRSDLCEREDRRETSCPPDAQDDVCRETDPTEYRLLAINLLWFRDKQLPAIRDPFDKDHSRFLSEINCLLVTARTHAISELRYLDWLVCVLVHAARKRLRSMWIAVEHLVDHDSLYKLHVSRAVLARAAEQ